MQVEAFGMIGTKIRKRFGWAGFGFLTALLEAIAASAEARIAWSAASPDEWASDFDFEHVAPLVAESAKLGVLRLDGGYLTSPAIAAAAARKAAQRDAKSRAGKAGAAARHKQLLSSDQADAKQPDSSRQDVVKHSQNAAKQLPATMRKDKAIDDETAVSARLGSGSPVYSNLLKGTGTNSKKEDLTQPPARSRYGQFVELSDDERAKALRLFQSKGLNDSDLNRGLELLDSQLAKPAYRKANPSHFHCLTRWVVRAVLDEKTAEARLANSQKRYPSNGKAEREQAAIERFTGPEPISNVIDRLEVLK